MGCVRMPVLALSAVCAISVDHQPSALEKAVVGQRNDRQTGENEPVSAATI